MIRVLALMLAYSLSGSLATASPVNLIPEKLQALKDAKTKLDQQFEAFVTEVKVCSPPAFMTDVINGFTGVQENSAKSLLGARMVAVEGHLTEAELRFSGLGDLKAACRGGNAAIEAKVTEAESIVREVLLKLESETNLYETGQKVALQNEGKVRQILGARLRIGVSTISNNEQIEGCKRALAFLGEAGKISGAMRDADREFREKLAGLRDGYIERASAIRVASLNACDPAMQRAGIFPSFREDGERERANEYQVADIPTDTGAAGSAR